MSDDAGLPLYPLPLGYRHRGDWVPLHVDRLLGSAFVARVDPAAGFRAILLWAESVRQSPAGTLPDDDVQLAHLAGFGRDVEGWRAVREGALYGWFPALCSEDGDGGGDVEVRLAHRVVTEMVMDAANRDRERRRKAAEGAHRKRLDRLRDAMTKAGATPRLVQSEAFVGAVLAELDARGEAFRPAPVRAAMERVSMREDGAARAGVVTEFRRERLGGD